MVEDLKFQGKTIETSWATKIIYLQFYYFGRENGIKLTNFNVNKVAWRRMASCLLFCSKSLDPCSQFDVLQS